MSISNPSPHFKGLGQRITRAVEGGLLRMQAEIHELERRFEVVDGKTQAHYHKWLEEFKQDQEALQEELSRMKEGGTKHP